MFSKSCEYAIRAIIFIAQKSGNGSKIGFREVAKGIDAPEAFLAKILQELVRQGLLQSVKGPNGGFFTDAACLRQTLADVVKAIDGERIFKGCALGLKQCSEKTPCPIHDEFKQVREHIKQLLKSATIADFVTATDRTIGFLKR